MDTIVVIVAYELEGKEYKKKKWEDTVREE